MLGLFDVEKRETKKEQEKGIGGPRSNYEVFGYEVSIT
jgi:hypothetical protein